MKYFRFNNKHLNFSSFFCTVFASLLSCDSKMPTYKELYEQHQDDQTFIITLFIIICFVVFLYSKSSNSDFSTNISPKDRSLRKNNNKNDEEKSNSEKIFKEDEIQIVVEDDSYLYYNNRLCYSVEEVKMMRKFYEERSPGSLHITNFSIKKRRRHEQVKKCFIYTIQNKSEGVVTVYDFITFEHLQVNEELGINISDCEIEESIVIENDGIKSIKTLFKKFKFAGKNDFEIVKSLKNKKIHPDYTILLIRPYLVYIPILFKINWPHPIGYSKLITIDLDEYKVIDLVDDLSQKELVRK